MADSGATKSEQSPSSFGPGGAEFGWGLQWFSRVLFVAHGVAY